MKNKVFLLFFVFLLCLPLAACQKEVTINEKIAVTAKSANFPEKPEITLTLSQQQTIRQILNGKIPDEGATNCAADILITAGNTVFSYHRACGSVQIKGKNQNFTLSPEEQRLLLSIFGQPE